MCSLTSVYAAGRFFLYGYDDDEFRDDVRVLTSVFHSCAQEIEAGLKSKGCSRPGLQTIGKTIELANGFAIRCKPDIFAT